MKEILILSGKGGTGKTSITASFAWLAGKTALLADCDVDAANLHLLSAAMQGESEDFYSGFSAKIDPEKCIACGKCIDVCAFDAISQDYVVDDLSCEGCTYCAHVCPADAVLISEALSGQVRVSHTRFSSTLVDAELSVGGENSGKVVTEVKKTAKRLALEQGKDLILVDGPPGIGCPVIASLSGVAYVMIVTEATVSGYNDLARVYEIIQRFKISCGLLINKADLDIKSKENILAFAREKDIEIFGEIAYDPGFSKALKEGLTVVEYMEYGTATVIRNAWERLTWTVLGG